MVAADLLQDPRVRQWLDGVEPAWTLLTFNGLRALREEPSAGQTAIQIAIDLSADEIAGSAVARNTLSPPVTKSGGVDADRHTGLGCHAGFPPRLEYPESRSRRCSK